ncbi:MAG: glycosyl transferase, partial [Rhodospirillaceae bacterium]|nr:glycosyl transferase [Rhodospirillaceae bacterium]
MSEEHSIPVLEAKSGTDKPVTILQVLPALVQGGVERGTVEVAGAIVAA